MHDSLQYRFRGALLGAWLGERMADVALSPPSPRDGDRITPPLIQLLRHQTARLSLMESSIRSLEGDDAHPIALTLPIALFYHDQPQVLQQAIQQHLPATQLAASTWAIVLGQTVSLLLRDRLQPDTWLESMLHWVHSSADPALMGQLQQVQNWLERPTSLAAIGQWVQQQPINPDASLPILQALYCFLSTPDSYWLTLQRLQQFSGFTPVSGLIAGFLSGAYNGVIGIPQIWRQQLGASSGASSSFYMEPACPAHSLSEADLFETADRLLAVWAGIDAWANWQPLQHRHLITAPRVLRFR